MLDDKRIEIAERFITQMLGVASLKGKPFIDKGGLEVVRKT